MRIISCADENTVAEANILEFKKLYGELKRPLRGFFPTGNSPKKTYGLFSKDAGFWSTRLTAIQIDEFVEGDGLFLSQLKRNLLNPLNLSAVESWNPSMTDFEVAEHVESVLSRDLDFAFLGLGPNGHVGFHEPGDLGPSFMGGRVEISELTRKRVPGAGTGECFTFGVGTFLRARKIILTVTGADKGDVLKNFMVLGETRTLPATLLKSHPNLIVTTNIR